MIDPVDAFLEHHGVKGMKWGKRTAKTIGRGSKRTGVAIGRGIKKTAKFSKDNPKVAASIATGAAFIVSSLILKKKMKDIKTAKETAIGRKVLDEYLFKQRVQQAAAGTDKWVRPSKMSVLKATLKEKKK